VTVHYTRIGCSYTYTIATKNDTINSAKPRTLGLGSDSEIQEIELNIRRLEEDALNALRKAEEAAEIAGSL
jgi:hypothetical protein